jgi:hypothetical protein
MYYLTQNFFATALWGQAFSLQPGFCPARFFHENGLTLGPLA